MIRKLAYTATALIVCSSLVYAKNSYNPDQLQQFNTYNQCNNCDLSGASFSGNHSSAVLAQCNLTGSNGKGTFSATNFSGSNLSSADWSDANLSYAQLSYIPLIKSDFTNADLSYANFEGANTTDAIFANANLYGSNITQQQLDSSKSYCNAILPDGTKKNC